MIEKLIGVFTFLAGFAYYFFNKGKQSIEINENKEVVKNVQIRNKIIDDVSKLSDDELNARLQKFTRPSSR